VTARDPATASARAGVVRFRRAEARDADAVARLHAESWRGHYRGAYSDAFLDGDVVADRLAAWSEKLRAADPRRCTILAEDRMGARERGLVGFANTVFEDDPVWGALLDNLHVAYGQQRRGIGTQLLALTAAAVLERLEGRRLYVWVLEQNVNAQAFYEACGARPVGREAVRAPGGAAGRLVGSPLKLRYAWDERETERLHLHVDTQGA
jgi:ribosomal protein S18 acetylase RimI-like enzyme